MKSRHTDEKQERKIKGQAESSERFSSMTIQSFKGTNRKGKNE